MADQDAISAVRDLVHAVQEALLCGARSEHTNAPGALVEMHNHSQRASDCIETIEAVLKTSLSADMDEGKI